jgi:hypothetical protein
MIISSKPFIRNNIQKQHCNTFMRMKETIDVYSYLSDLGFRPYDCSVGLITFQRAKFFDFVKKHFGGKCSKLKIKTGTIYSVWIDYVELSYLDIDEHADWEEYVPPQ